MTTETESRSTADSIDVLAEGSRGADASMVYVVEVAVLGGEPRGARAARLVGAQPAVLGWSALPATRP